MSEQTRTYYAAAANLVVNINKGQRVIENGQSTLIGQKVAEFNSSGDNFGRLVTSDPEVISVLDRRMHEQGDVFDGAEYTRRTTPPEIRLRMLEQEHARTIEENNRLLAKLKSEGRAVSK